MVAPAKHLVWEGTRGMWFWLYLIANYTNTKKNFIWKKWRNFVVRLHNCANTHHTHFAAKVERYFYEIYQKFSVTTPNFVAPMKSPINRWLQHIIVSTNDDAFCSPKYDFWRPRRGLQKKFLGLLLLAIFCGTLINYTIIQPLYHSVQRQPRFESQTLR